MPIGDISMRVQAKFREELNTSLCLIHSEYMQRACRVGEQVAICLGAREDLMGVNRESIAANLCVSSRTLTRKLSAEGTTFKCLLNEERMRRCQRYLDGGGFSGAELSQLLGFEDPSYFYKAFQKWTDTKFRHAKKNNEVLSSRRLIG